MGSAYTPGLTVSADVVVRRIRRLPIKGEVLVKVGDPVEPETIVARALLPGILQTFKFGEKLGVEPRDVPAQFPFKVGDALEKDQFVLQTKGFLGMGKQTILCPYEGTVESISDITGNVLLREPPIPVDVTAYLKGKVADVMPEEGAVIETRGAMAQGIFGVGGETVGAIHVAVGGHDQVLKADNIHEEHKGKILVGGAGMTLDAMQRASEVGVAGVVAGGLKDQDLVQFLGYDIGVAITGQEAINVTLMVTEGFGFLPMALRTFELFQSLEGKVASMNGATQIRAGVIRPEVIAPMESGAQQVSAVQSGGELSIGTSIRVIREPYFGQLGVVTDLPSTLQVVESGTHVRVLKAKLQDGAEVSVPRANVEIMAG